MAHNYLLCIILIYNIRLYINSYIFLYFLMKNVSKCVNFNQKHIQAKEIESTRGTIGNFENGNKKPSLDMLIKLADYFDVSIDYLVGRTDDPKLHQKED